MNFLASIIKFLSAEEDTRLKNKSPILPVYSLEVAADVVVNLNGGENEDGENYEEYEEEEEDEEQEEEIYDWNTEDEFIEFIKNKTGKKEPEKKDLYFEMISTKENETLIWWLPAKHPYVKMILRTNRDEGHAKYKSYDSYRQLVAFEDTIIEIAVTTIMDLLLHKKNGSTL